MLRALACLPFLFACGSEEPTAKPAPPGVQERLINQKLYEDSLAMIDAGDLDGAAKLAGMLEAKGQSTGFELLARMHKAAGEPAEAVAVLERGVEAHPGDWLLWQFLGSARVDAGRFDAAEEAYTRAATCEGANADWLRVDRAVLANRRGDHPAARDLALPLLESDDGELGPRAFDAWVRARAGLGEERHGLAAEVVTRIHAAEPIHTALLTLLRDLVALPSPEAHSWSLELALSPGPDGKREGSLGARARALVVARTAEDAVHMVRQLLPEDRYAEVKSRSAEDGGLRPELVRGVYELEVFLTIGVGKQD